MEQTFTSTKFVNILSFFANSSRDWDASKVWNRIDSIAPDFCSCNVVEYKLSDCLGVYCAAKIETPASPGIVAHNGAETLGFNK